MNKILPYYKKKDAFTIKLIKNYLKAKWTQNYTAGSLCKWTLAFILYILIDCKYIIYCPVLGFIVYLLFNNNAQISRNNKKKSHRHKNFQ